MLLNSVPYSIKHQLSFDNTMPKSTLLTIAFPPWFFYAASTKKVACAFNRAQPLQYQRTQLCEFDKNTISHIWITLKCLSQKVVLFRNAKTIEFDQTPHQTIQVSIHLGPPQILTASPELLQLSHQRKPLRCPDPFGPMPPNYIDVVRTSQLLY